ncbi:unnamed protein product [Rotaria magnacalcarata]
MSRFADYDANGKELTPVGGYWSYPLVSLEEALEPIVPQLNQLDRSIKAAKKYCCHPSNHGLTRDESAALLLYTMEGGENSFYRALNKILRDEDRAKIKPWFLYLKLLDTALNKLPTVKGCVWRGVCSKIIKSYKENDVLTWWNVSSCSSSIDVVEHFISTDKNSTLFMIEASNGKELTGYTMYPNEKEVVLGIGTQLIVKSNAMNHGNLNVVHLAELDDSSPTIPIPHPDEVRRKLKLSNKSVIGEEYIVPSLRGCLTDISPSVRWAQEGVTVVGRNGQGTELNQLSEPHGLYVDEEKTVYVADTENHRIVAWKCDSMSGFVVAGGNGEGNGNDQLNHPTDVIIDKETDSLIICDRNNRRVMQWPRYGGITGKKIISGFDCYSMTMGNQRFLYVSSPSENAVRRFRLGESRGTVVAGGNGEGDCLDQLHLPYYIFVDRDNSLYVSDEQNHRVMKWIEGAKEGTVVAGGRGPGNDLKRLYGPQGVVVDECGTVYVAELWNHRIMRWLKGATQGSILAGENSEGGKANQLNNPEGLSFDNDGNLYVTDRCNNRVQRFNIEMGDEQPSSAVAALGKTAILLDNTVSGKLSFESTVSRNISPNATWTSSGCTVSGGYGRGDALNQLDGPYGLYVDEERTVYIADCWNHRIMEWKFRATSGKVIAGGNGQGCRADQLNGPVDVIVDKATDSLIISDRDNRRVVRWNRRSGTTCGETILSNVMCWGLAMDNERCLYVTDTEKHDVRRYQPEEAIGKVVSGGHGKGDHLNQLNYPTFVFVDRDRSVYVSDNWNHRVMKWANEARQGIIVADGSGEEYCSTPLKHPRGVFVDQSGTVYVSDLQNHRVMRFRNEATYGEVIAGGNGQGPGMNQFYEPGGLSFDQDWNLYIADRRNHRVQRFSMNGKG